MPSFFTVAKYRDASARRADSPRIHGRAHVTRPLSRAATRKPTTSFPYNATIQRSGRAKRVPLASHFMVFGNLSPVTSAGSSARSTAGVAARAQGTTVEKLERIATAKGEYLGVRKKLARAE